MTRLTNDEREQFGQAFKDANPFVAPLTAERHSTKNFGLKFSAVLLAQGTVFIGSFGEELKTTLRAIYATILQDILL